VKLRDKNDRGDSKVISRFGNFGWAKKWVCGILLGCYLLSACNPGEPVVIQPTVPGRFETQGRTPSPVITQTPSGLWIESAVPDQLKQLALKAGIPPANSFLSASTRLVLAESQNFSQGSDSIDWIYALVTPFPSLVESVELEEILGKWMGKAAPALAGGELWMDENTLTVFSSLWGTPAPQAVRTGPAGDLSEILWSSQKPVFAILPFENLGPRWKILSVGGQSPVHKEFDRSAYPLVVTFECVGESCASLHLPVTNRDPSKLTVVVMTGVTALVRRTAWTMEQKGILYPARDIRDWLRNADITHISNEIPFAQDCPTPDPNQEQIRFCSAPRYIGLLEDVGADVIEMTGNHFQDWGSSATLYTIELYRQRGLPYYGGGADLVDSRRPVEIIHNGNRIAFIGCNASGPDYAWATDSQPGAAPCEDLAWMAKEIARLRSEGFLPIATFQYYEYYTPEPRPNQIHDFQLVAEAGAVIVSGSQAHIPQALEFHNGSFIFYGLGNLFFDQMVYPIGNVLSPNTRRELITRHVFYDNKHINTELLTAMLEDYARPRPMTGQERIQLLTDLFSVSGWK
jgi:hypothetical protein